MAAVFVAAEAWREHCSAERVAEDLRERFEAQDREVHRRLRETSYDVQQGLVASYATRRAEAKRAAGL